MGSNGVWLMTSSGSKEHHEYGRLIFLRKGTFFIAIVSRRIPLIAVSCRKGGYNVGITMLVLNILLD